MVIWPSRSIWSSYQGISHINCMRNPRYVQQSVIKRIPIGRSRAVQVDSWVCLNLILGIQGQAPPDVYQVGPLKQIDSTAQISIRDKNRFEFVIIIQSSNMTWKGCFLALYIAAYSMTHNTCWGSLDTFGSYDFTFSRRMGVVVSVLYFAAFFFQIEEWQVRMKKSSQLLCLKYMLVILQKTDRAVLI